MDEVKTKGIVIKTGEFGEGHKILTLFTAELGIIHAVSYGAKKSSKSKSAEGQLFVWGDFMLRRRGEMYTAVSANTADGFYPIYEDIYKLALASYFSELTAAALGIGNPDRDVLRLFLNTVYALAYTSAAEDKVKAAFELRLMCECGFMPVTDECVKCSQSGAAAFSHGAGGVVCAECAGSEDDVINENIRRAMHYITECDGKKIFAFTLPKEDAEIFYAVCERYALVTLEKNFPSLEYYKRLLRGRDNGK